MASVTALFDVARETIDESAEVPYLIVDAADEEAAGTALAAAVPSTYHDLSLDKIEITDRVNETSWKAEARYKAEDDPDELENEYDFDTGGGIQHITQNIITVSRYGAKASTQEMGAIGFDGKTVQGCDIIVPKFEWGETRFKYWVPASNEWAYKQILMNLTGKTNNAAFRGFSQGEVLFLGARGRRTGGLMNYWRIDYRFAASPNETGLAVGDITGIAKWGWEYLDIRYQEKDATDVVITIPEPIAVLIHKVYKAGDFSTLDIGTTV